MDENDVKIRERVTKIETDLANEIKEREKLSEIIEEMRDIVSEIRHMRLELNEISAKVTGIEERPAKRWESIVAGILGAIAGTIGTAIITKIIGG